MSSSQKIYDHVHKCYLSQKSEIPEGAMIIQGGREVADGISIATPVLIKYRDGKTDSKTALEEALRF